MSKESFVYKVNVRDFKGIGQDGLEVTFESDFELDDREISNKVQSLVISEYNKLAHEANYKIAYEKLMNIKGMKGLKKLDQEVIEIKHEVIFECLTDELE